MGWVELGERDWVGLDWVGPKTLLLLFLSFKIPSEKESFLEVNYFLLLLIITTSCSFFFISKTKDVCSLIMIPQLLHHRGDVPQWLSVFHESTERWQVRITVVLRSMNLASGCLFESFRVHFHCQHLCIQRSKYR